MSEPALRLEIQRIDTRRDDVRSALGQLREKLSPRGDIVSEAGRRRTIAVFGEPLSPQQVVELMDAGEYVGNAPQKSKEIAVQIRAAIGGESV